jgi:hypothetical protein
MRLQTSRDMNIFTFWIESATYRNLYLPSYLPPRPEKSTHYACAGGTLKVMCSQINDSIPSNAHTPSAYSLHGWKVERSALFSKIA